MFIIFEPFKKNINVDRLVGILIITIFKSPKSSYIFKIHYHGHIILNTY